VNLFSDKYFYYSQLYNKHIAYSLSIEKSEEILGNFNRIIGQYHFSRASNLKDELLFIKREINVQHDLNPSRQIKIIKNIINLQLYLFCEIDSADNSNIEELLRETIKIIDELPESSIYKYWITALDFLSFEYYFKIGRKEQAAIFYESVNSKFQSILLYTNVCCTPIFLISKLAFIQETGRLNELLDFENTTKNTEINDTHSAVCIGIYDAMVYYYKNNLKEAINCLQHLINENSFKDYFHINIEIKFTLAIFYIKLNDFEMSLSILKSIYRKIKLDKLDNYQNALSLIKVLEQEANNKIGKVTTKQKDDFLLFMARNKNESEILKHISYSLNKKYS
jgi:tetratricopeptide (TPR) repeat protein